MLSRLKTATMLIAHGLNIIAFCVLSLWIGACAYLAQDGKLPQAPRMEAR